MPPELTRLAPARPPAEATPTVPRRRPDGYELGILVLFALVSMWVLGLDLWQVVVNHRTWTGTDGLFVVDQLQYLSWIQSASQHGLVANMFVLRGTPADYFQPAVLISGLLSDLGVPGWVALLVWKPVAVLSSFLAIRAYVHGSLGGLWARRAALVLALFFGSFTVVYGAVGVIGDMFPGFLSWGYTFGLMAMAAMTAALVSLHRARAGRRVSLIPGLLGALAGLLHPWHGELLVAVIVLAEAMLWLWGRRTRSWRDLAPSAATVVLSGLPLVYYVLLGRLDLSWKLARESSRHHFSLWSVLLAAAPLLIAGLPAWRRRPQTFLAAATRAWPLAALAVFLFSASAASATPLHAVEGLTIPLSVLAVQGLTSIPGLSCSARRALAIAGIAVFTAPATYQELVYAKGLAAPTINNSNFITADESHALAYLRALPEPGGVLARTYMGSTVPGKTGRRTFMGDCLWSEPGCRQRGVQAYALMDGRLAGAAARTLVFRSGARFVLADCGATPRLEQTLAPLLVSVRRFGCATVYEVRSSGRPLGPLAQSGGHAALRAAGRQRRLL